MNNPVVLYYSAETRKPSMLLAIKLRLIWQCEARQMRLITVGAAAVQRPVKRMDGIDRKTDREYYRLMAENIYTRILAGLQSVGRDDVVYLAEDDVLYADAHFDMHQRIHRTMIGYDLNLIYLTPGGFVDACNRASPALSMCLARADVLRWMVVQKLEELRTGRWTAFEWYGSQGYLTCHDWAAVASMDVRENKDHTWNVSAEKRRYQTEPGWAETADELLKRYEITEGEA
jgi:hypothetical protein